MPASKSLCQAVGITVSFSWGISLFCSVPYFLPWSCHRATKPMILTAANLKGEASAAWELWSESSLRMRWLHLLKGHLSAEALRNWQHIPLGAIRLSLGGVVTLTTSLGQDRAFTNTVEKYWSGQCTWPLWKALWWKRETQWSYLSWNVIQSFTFEEQKSRFRPECKGI